MVHRAVAAVRVKGGHWANESLDGIVNEEKAIEGFTPWSRNGTKR